MFLGHDDGLSPNVAPSSSCSIVPQSVSRPSRDDLLVTESFTSSVQATPTRKSSVLDLPKRKGNLFSAGNDDQTSFPPSPLHTHDSSAQLFAAVPDSAVKVLDTSRRPNNIQGTPVKQRSRAGPQDSRPETFLDGDKENVIVQARSTVDGGLSIRGQEESIYKSLGWDDDFDELA